MVIDYKHSFTPEEVKERLKALSDYLDNRHGIKVTWTEDMEKATFNGKYMVVKIIGDMWLEDGEIHFRGQDPGFMWRKRALKYLNGKLDMYLDPKTPVDELPRDKK